MFITPDPKYTFKSAEQKTAISGILGKALFCVFQNPFPSQ
jgi:hypothetical protein